MNVVQYNKDNREVSPMFRIVLCCLAIHAKGHVINLFTQGSNGSVDIDFLCGWMTNTSLGDPLHRLVALHTKLDPFRTGASFTATLMELNQTSWNSPAAFGGMGRVYTLTGAFRGVAAVCVEHGKGSPSGQESPKVLLPSFVCCCILQSKESSYS